MPEDRQSGAAPEAGLPDDLEAMLRDARQRFVAAFPAQCDSMACLLDELGDAPEAGAVAHLRGIVHRLVGLAGTIGFPTVSARAAKLEELVQALEHDALDIPIGRSLVQSLREGFTKDLAAAPVSARLWTAAPAGAKVLIADDDDMLRAVVAKYLTANGHTVVEAASGDIVQDLARRERPAVIVLDVDMPGADGYSVCRLLKLDPELSGIPVVFVTARSHLDERLAGLALGADEFLHKPIDLRELALRLHLLVDRHRAQPAPSAGSDDRVLTYQAFVAAAESALRTGGALAIVRVPADVQGAYGGLLAGEMRGRDLVCSLDASHVLLFLPGLTADSAQARVSEAVAVLARQCAREIHAGLATAAAGGSLPALLMEADAALLHARYSGTAVVVAGAYQVPSGPAGVSRTILLADDDPDVARIVDAQMRAAGYQTTIVFDGDQAMRALDASEPDLLVLDLMMPKATGFDVLASLRQRQGRRPRIVVLSAKGREQDVMRAFDCR